MQHAIIVTGGKQYRVAEGDILFIEKLPVESGETVTFDQVLAVVNSEADPIIGTPTVAGAGGDEKRFPSLSFYLTGVI